MPYTPQKPNREECFKQGLKRNVTWLKTLPVEKRKGDVTFELMYLALSAFDSEYSNPKQSYFGLSTAESCLQRALKEVTKKLDEYEANKKEENGDV